MSCWCCQHPGCRPRLLCMLLQLNCHPSSDVVMLGCTRLVQVRAVRATTHTVCPFTARYSLWQAAVVDTCLHRGTPCITVSELGPLFYSAGSPLFTQKAAVLWDQILVSLHVDPQQKMDVCAAVTHCSVFETGLVTVWNGVLRKQSSNGAQKRNSALTVVPSVWSLAPWQSSAAGIRSCKTHWGTAQMEWVQLMKNIKE